MSDFADQKIKDIKKKIKEYVEFKIKDKENASKL